MVDAIRHARSYVEGLSKKNSLADKKTQQAVILNIAVIGKAATQLANECPAFADQTPELLWNQRRGGRIGLFDKGADLAASGRERSSRTDVAVAGLGTAARQFVFNRRYAYDCAMPAIRGIPGPYRLFFVSFDCHEPRHVHVQPERRVCKYWMEPIALASNHGFSPVELNTVRQLLRDNRNQILEAWDEHCGSRR